MDPAIRGLSLAARGLHHDLLCYAWVNGSIPAATRTLAKLVGMPAVEFAGVWHEVEELWHPGTDPAWLVCEMLQAERAKYSKQARRRSEAASKAAQVRWTAAKKAKKKAASKVGEYSEPFNQFWSVYPARAGGNPKRGAHRAWLATLRRGVDADLVLAGAVRYARFCTATKKAGTEYVMMAATFLGPNEHWSELWIIPKGKAVQQSLDLRRIHQ